MTRPLTKEIVKEDSRADKRALLVRAAVRVFANRGFDAATLRDITDIAGVNIAAVNYYFQSKDELLKHALESCFAPLNAGRMAALDRLTRESGDQPLRLEDVVEALVRPVVELGMDEDGGRAPVRLLLQARALPRPITNQILSEHFDVVHSRFLRIFADLLPHIDADELALRYEFARGAVLHIVADLDPVVRRLVGLRVTHSLTDNDRIVSSLVGFISAGFRS